jgi:DNA adenine methylase
VKPLFSYYGGKQRLVPQILPILESIPHTVYCEAFAGGTACLFAKTPPPHGNSDYYREVINDTNNLVINFYRTAKARRDELFALVDTTLYSQEEHRKAKAICEDPTSHDALTLAWAFYVNINFSFSKTLGRGWSTATRGKNNPYEWQARKYRFLEASARLDCVYIASEDALDCIRRWDSSQTLFYLDPPYPEANQGHYGGYTLEDWTNLCNLLDEIAGSYVLSNYPQPVEPKSAQKRLEIEATMSASKGPRERRTEVLWVCDRSNAMRDDLKVLTERVGLFGGV